MSDYNTGNLVPSTDPRDLDDNATNFDRLLMSTAPTVLDRLGVPRKTWYQMEQDASALVSPNVSALAAAISAANKLFYFTDSGTGTVTDFSSQARVFCAAATTSAQRSAIGAGTASTLDQATSTGDTTAGRAFRVGDHGVGRQSLEIATDLNTLAASAFHRTDISTANRPSNLDGVVATFPYAVGAAGAQVYIDVTGAFRWRYNPNLGDGAWNSAAKTGANSDITSLTGLTTPLTVGQGGTGATSMGAGAVGAVTQSSGLPTGKIIERGSNANGSYTKWADGSMECTKYITSESVAITTANGNVFTGLAAPWTFPVPFVGDRPVLTGHCHDESAGAVMWLSLRGGAGVQTLTSGTFRLVSGLSVTLNVVLAYSAKGRWF